MGAIDANRLSPVRRGTRPMNVSPQTDPVLTLAIDIGGSHLKVGLLDEGGTMTAGPNRVKTPQPADPSRVVAALVDLAGPLGGFDRISVGFPGAVRAGQVLTAPNLGTDAWRGFALAARLAELIGKPTRVLNDASVQGLGAIAGQGVELVLTLGTGMGFALFHDGRLAPHLEMGQHLARKRKTYDEYVGHAALEAIGKRHWNKRVRRVISALKTLVEFDMLYLGGGNAKLITGPLPETIATVSNQAGITGGVRLWDARMDAAFDLPAVAFARVGQA
jgi:polyphosphate glucokinase